MHSEADCNVEIVFAVHELLKRRPDLKCVSKGSFCFLVRFVFSIDILCVCVCFFFFLFFLHFFFFFFFDGVFVFFLSVGIGVPGS